MVSLEGEKYVFKTDSGKNNQSIVPTECGLDPDADVHS